jgi:hypothetical protein
MKNQQGAPEALRLADALYDGSYLLSVERYTTADELRRLHAENERLATHVQNPAKIEHVAGDVSKNGPESNIAQQPAPSAAAVVNPDPHAELRKTWRPGQRWQARSFRNGQWGPWTDAVASEPFWFPHQDYRRHPDDLAPQPSPTPQADESPIPADYGGEPRIGCGLEGAHPKIVWIANTAYAMRNMHTLDGTWRGQLITMAAAANFVAKQIAALEPTPQADSQPAPAEVADAMADSQYLAGVSAGWNAANADDPNAALQKLHESRAGYLKPLSASRAPADSVTAPAGGNGLVDGAAICEAAARKWEKEAKRHKRTPGNLPSQHEARDLEKARLCRNLAEKIRSTQPAQAAPGVLEDAAREAIDKVLALFPFNAPIQTFTIGGGPHLTADGDTEFYSVKRVLAFLTEIKTTLDAARNQGGAT